MILSSRNPIPWTCKKGLHNIPKMEQIENAIRIDPHRSASRRLIGLIPALRIHSASLGRRFHPHLAGLAMLASLIDGAIHTASVGIAISIGDVSSFARARPLGRLDNALGRCLDDFVRSCIWGRRGNCDLGRRVLGKSAGAFAFRSHGWVCVCTWLLLLALGTSGD
jgi:hypothetical protein